MNNIDLQTQDIVLLDIGDIVTDEPIPALVTKAVYNSNDFSIDVEFWLPVLAGQRKKWKFAFPMGLNEVDSWPQVTDLVGGDAGSPLNMQVPSGLNFRLGGGSVDFPIDMGRPNVGDLFDSSPKDPSNPFKEIDYIQLATEPIKIETNLNADLDDEGEQHAVPEDPVAPKEEENKVTSTRDKNLKIVHLQGLDTTVASLCKVIWVADNFGDGQYIRNDDLAAEDKNQFYNINLGDGYIIQARAVGVWTDKVTLKPGTPVLLQSINGSYVFELRNNVKPAVITDPENQLLDDPSVWVDDAGKMVTGGRQ